MDIVFNHAVGLTALINGQATRLRYGSNEKVPNVYLDSPDGVITLEARSHHDVFLADGTILKSVPHTAFRVEPSFSNETSTTKRRTAKAETVSTK